MEGAEQGASAELPRALSPPYTACVGPLVSLSPWLGSPPAPQCELIPLGEEVSTER